MITKIYQSIFTKPLSVLLAVCILSLSFSWKSDDEPVNLMSGTLIPLETTTMIMSDLAIVGQSVDFRVSRDVVVDGKTVIKAGSIAKGQVLRAQRAKGLGKAGYLEVQVKSVQAVDGQEIYLVGSNLYQEGEEKQTLAIVLGVLVCLLFLTIKGKNAIIPAGYGVSATVGATTPIMVN